MDHVPSGTPTPGRVLQHLNVYLNRGVLEEVENQTLGRNAPGGLWSTSYTPASKVTKRGDPIGLKAFGIVGSCYQVSVGRVGSERRRTPYDLGRVTNTALWSDVAWQYVTALHIQDASIQRSDPLDECGHGWHGYDGLLWFLAFTNVVLVDCLVDIRRLVDYVRERKRRNRSVYGYVLYLRDFAYGSAIA